MKKNEILLLFCCIGILNFPLFAQKTKAEIEKILTSQKWKEKIDTATINTRHLPKVLFPIFASFHHDEFTKEGIRKSFKENECFSECNYTISEDGKYMLLESGKNHNPKYPTFKYKLELKKVTENSFQFGKSDDRQYRGFENNEYVSFK